MQKQSFQSASRGFAKLETQYPQTLHLLEYQARCDVFSDDLQSANNLFKKILHLDPGYISSMDAFASVLKKLNDVTTLSKITHKFSQIAPHRSETWSAISLIHNLKFPKQFKFTLAFIDKALRLNPTYWFGYVQKGWLYLRQSLHEKSVECFRNALRIEANVFSYTGLVKAKLSDDKSQEAVNLASECLKLFPESPIALSLMGSCLARFPDCHAKAMGFFSQALKIAHHSIDAIAGITELLVVEKKFTEAVAILERQLEYGRHNDLLHTRLAEIYHLEGSHGKALEHYHAALSVNPNLEVAKDGLALLSKEVLGDSEADKEEEDEDDIEFNDLSIEDDDGDGLDDMPSEILEVDGDGGILPGDDFASDEEPDGSGHLMF